MSKQHPRDAREPRDLHHLLITDSGWDSLCEDGTWTRDISTSAALSAEQRKQLLAFIGQQPPCPGLRVVMQVRENGTDHTFYTRASNG